MKNITYKDVLKNKQIIDIYNNVDKQDKKPWATHGLKHIKRVLKYAKTLCKMFKIDEKTANLTFLACALHDIGSIGGKHKHAERSYIFAQNYLKNAQFNTDDASIILEAIRNHHTSYTDSSLVHVLLVLCDKLDCTKKRILKEGNNIVGMRQSAYIKNIRLQKTANLFKICFKTTKKFNKIEFLEYVYTQKLLESASIFASIKGHGFSYSFL
ncbi:MAG: HD domain-containing protein [Clostridia bacterium]|nr:HD domain-containing protein [Clostridia bacterium]